MVQEISTDYFIRLGACQGKFLDWVRDAVVLCGLSVEMNYLPHFQQVP